MDMGIEIEIAIVLLVDIYVNWRGDQEGEAGGLEERELEVGKL
jgi:hypothetical protein